MTALSEVQSLVEPYLDHVALLVKNNPTKDIGQLLNRSDVLSSWTEIKDALSSSVEVSGDQEFDARISTDLDSIAESLKEALDAYISAAWEDVPIPLSYHQDPHNGVSNVRSEWGRRRAEALRHLDTEPALRSGVLRLVFARQTAKAKAEYENGLSSWSADGKRWLANFVDNTPCPRCAGLHGTVVPVAEVFPVEGKTYGPLLAPPLHPRCHCRIEQADLSEGTTAPEKTTPESVTPEPAPSGFTPVQIPKPNLRPYKPPTVKPVQLPKSTLRPHKLTPTQFVEVPKSNLKPQVPSGTRIVEVPKSGLNPHRLQWQPIEPLPPLDQSSHFSSSEIRNMPKKRFAALMAALMAIVLRHRAPVPKHRRKS